MSKITSCKIEPAVSRSHRIIATLENGTEHLLFHYFPDELHFTEAEFVGKTIQQAEKLRRAKDVAWMQTDGPAGNGIARTGMTPAEQAIIDREMSH